MEEDSLHDEERRLVINKSRTSADDREEVEREMRSDGGASPQYGSVGSPTRSTTRLSLPQFFLRWAEASTYQQKGNKELFISRFNSTKSRAVVSDVSMSHMPHRRIGAQMRPSDMDDYGQWISESNSMFDSLDYEDIESVACQEAKARCGGDIDPPQWKMWLIIVISGIFTGVVAYGIDQSIKFLFHLKFSATQHYMSTPSMKYYSNSTDPAAAQKTIPFFVPWLVFTAINLAMVSVAAALVVFGEPLAKGSGIGEIKCYLNGIRLYRVVRIKTLVCKLVGILFSVASGLPCGKEGPMIHSGAAIAGGVSTGKSSKMHFDTGLFKEFRSDRMKRHFVTAGAAAGVGVAFGAPIGGLLFAIEEVGSFWSPELTVMVFVCSAIAPWTLQRLNEPSSSFGSVRGLMSFGVIEGNYHYWDLPFLVLLGILGGLLGTVFIKVNVFLGRLRQKHCKTYLKRMLEVLAVSTLVSTTLMILVTFGFTCQDVKGDETAELSSNLVKFGCNNDQYNDMATYWFRSMEDTIHLMTHSSEFISFKTVLLRFIPFFIITILTYGIHVPSGLFLPSLALGVNFGHLYAQCWNAVLPSTLQLNVAHYALFGAGAVLGGIVRMTISIIVIIMEATSNTTFFYPLVVVTVFAKIGGNYFCVGIYDEHIELQHIPMLETHLARPEMNLMCAGDLMVLDIVLIGEKMTVSELVMVLKANPLNNSLIVVDRKKRLRGVLRRRQALILLDKKVWEHELQFEDFAKSSKEREFLKLKKYKFFERIPDSVGDKVIDVSRYMDQWPFYYPTTAPASRIHRLFRELGLRLVIVVDDDRVPIGFIGRKQLCHLEMVDPNTLPPTSPGPRPYSMDDVYSGALPSWKDLTEWQDAYVKRVN